MRLRVATRVMRRCDVTTVVRWTRTVVILLAMTNAVGIIVIYLTVFFAQYISTIVHVYMYISTIDD